MNYYTTTSKGYKALTEAGCQFVDDFRLKHGSGQTQLPCGQKITVLPVEGFKWEWVA